MKVRVREKIYDIEKSKTICDISTDFIRGDDRWTNGKLYQRTNGDFFILGEGGSETKFNIRIDENTWSDGWGLRNVSSDEAKEYASQFCSDDDYAELFEQDGKINKSIYKLAIARADYFNCKVICGYQEQEGWTFCDLDNDLAERLLQKHLIDPETRIVTLPTGELTKY